MTRKTKGCAGWHHATQKASNNTCHSTGRAPRLDLARLPGWAGDYARALSVATETPLELAAGMVLVTCATLADDRARQRASGAGGSSDV